MEKPKPSMIEIIEGTTNDSLNVQPDWFGLMNNSPKRCAPLGVPREPLQNKYLIVIKDAAISSIGYKNIEKIVDRLTAYRYLPIAEIECSGERAKEISDFPEVEWLLPALTNFDQLRNISHGFDILALVAEVQRQSIASSGITLIGGHTPGKSGAYPVILREDGDLKLQLDPSINWSTPAAIMPVVNMSIGTWASDYPFLKNDIINLATYCVACRGQLVVVSAGNCGQSSDGSKTMSAWAQAPWVLSVGATEDADGKILASYSSRGVIDDSQSGPDVVAWGQSGISNSKEAVGTSYAAPRVTFYAMLCAAALLELRHAMLVALGRETEGVRLVGCGFIDDFGKEINWSPKPRKTVTALPIVGLNMAGVEALKCLISNNDISIDIQGNAKILRFLLLNAARPIERYKNHEIGAGFLSEEIILDYLAKLTGKDILELFAIDGVPCELTVKASRFYMFNRTQLADLSIILSNTAPMWHYDWQRRRLGSRPFLADDGAISELTDFEFEYGESDI
jgi:hypothetical protein